SAGSGDPCARVLRARQAPGPGSGLFHHRGERPVRPSEGLEAMVQINRSSLLWKALIVVAVIDGLTILAVAAEAAWNVEQNWTTQFERRGAAIATALANASVEVLLFRDVSTIQSMIDSYTEFEGVGYVFVVNPQGEVLAHTFVPGIPPEVRALQGRKYE